MSERTAVTFEATAALAPGEPTQVWKAVMEATGPDVVRRVVAYGLSQGLIWDSFDAVEAGIWKKEGAYFGLLDLVDAGGEVVDDYAIPTPEAFAWWRRTLELRPVAEANPEGKR